MTFLLQLGLSSGEPAQPVGIFTNSVGMEDPRGQMDSRRYRHALLVTV